MVTPFDAVIGHPKVIGLLAAELESPAQAYLFVGPDGAGKATVARRFAAALLADGRPEPFRRALEGVHADLTIVEPSGTASITVDQARTVVSSSTRAPLEAARRVFLFEEGGLMNDEAANALLKTLEEPVATSVFILVATSEDDLPSTIASRSRTIVFGRVGEQEIVDALVARGADVDRAVQAARISGGRPGLALALVTEPDVAEYRRQWLGVPGQVTGHPGDSFRLAGDLLSAVDPLLAALKERQAAEAAVAVADGASTKTLKERHDRQLKRAAASLWATGLEILAGFYRDVAAAQVGAPVRNTDIPVSQLTQVMPGEAMRHADRVLETIESLEANQRPQLALAALFAELGGDA
ncbi:MAG: hypothetical protein HKN93_02470 [Acidimicrobiia bacterium]|nr:hypothetical protein [Acidimicrobiia bacterium]